MSDIDKSKETTSTEVLDEASIVRITRQAKLDRLTGKMAMDLAKQANDPMYLKAMKFRKAFMAMKKKINAKYGMKGKTAARKAISK